MSSAYHQPARRSCLSTRATSPLCQPPCPVTLPWPLCEGQKPPQQSLPFQLKLVMSMTPEHGPMRPWPQTALPQACDHHARVSGPWWLAKPSQMAPWQLPAHVPKSLWKPGKARNTPFVYFIFSKIYLFERKREQKQKTEMLYGLVHSPNECSGQGQASRSQRGASSPRGR